MMTAVEGEPFTFWPPPSSVGSDGGGAVDVDLGVAIGDGGVVIVVEVDDKVGGLVVEAVGEAGALDEGVARGGLGEALEVEGRALDVVALAGDGDHVVARVHGGPGAVVGAVAVVGEGLGGDVAVGTLDLDVKVEATVGDLLAGVVAGGDSEGSALVDLEGLAALDSGAGGGAVAGDNAGLDEDGGGGAVDGLGVDGGNDILVSRI